MVLGDKRHCPVAVTLPDFPGCPSLVVFHWENWHVWISPNTIHYLCRTSHTPGMGCLGSPEVARVYLSTIDEGLLELKLNPWGRTKIFYPEVFWGRFQKSQEGGCNCMITTIWICFFVFLPHSYPSNTQQITFFLVSQLLTSIQASLIFEVHVFLNCDKDRNFLFPFVESKLI